MASAMGFVSGLNDHLFLKGTPPGTDYTTTGGVVTPTADDLGTKTGEEAATKLVAKENFIPGIVQLGTEDKTANSIEFFIFGRRSSERIPGIASTQQFTLGFAMKYGDALFETWRKKVPGDYIEGAIITATGARGTAQAVTGLTQTNLSLSFFHGLISGTSFNFGTQSEPAQMNFTIDLTDPMHYITDATA